MFLSHLGAQIFSGRSRAVDFNQILARVLFSATGCQKDDDFRFARQPMIEAAMMALMHDQLKIGASDRATLLLYRR